MLLLLRLLATLAPQVLLPPALLLPCTQWCLWRPAQQLQQRQLCPALQRLRPHLFRSPRTITAITIIITITTTTIITIHVAVNHNLPRLCRLRMGMQAVAAAEKR